MTHPKRFPEQRLVRPGAVLGTIAHAVFVASAPDMEACHGWDGENYCVNNYSGGRGAIAFRGDRFVGVFFDSCWTRAIGRAGRTTHWGWPRGLDIFAS